mmetsp:Transcript_65150/g.201664  ORF Transcript_65150/g.201664 Transcript_65150/m.201664 type:complete len:432 (-) Transcript_65150:78-1373(-)
MASTRGGSAPRQSTLERIETSRIFQYVVIGVILLNTLLLSWEANSRDANLLPVFDVLDSIMLVFFVCEICFRLIVYRCNFFREPKERWWNIFDFTVVAIGVLDAWIMRPLLGTQGQQLFLFFRFTRILRVLRAFRLFKEFKKLRILARGLVESLNSVGWVAFMFLLVMFVYAIVITSLAGKNYADFDDPDERKIVKEKFGTILSSMETLFLFLTCDDWSTSARIVNKKYPLMEFVWISYIVIGAFTLLSLLTGLMADKMNQVRTEEEEKEAKEKAVLLEDFIEELKVMFDKADSSGDARVSPDEFEKMVCKRHCAEKLTDWGVPIMKAGEARQVFDALDRDGDQSLTWDEFRDGLLQLSRPFSAKDVMWLEGHVFKLDAALREKAGQNPGLAWDMRLNKVHAKATFVSERLGILERDLEEFFSHVGFQPPP